MLSEPLKNSPIISVVEEATEAGVYKCILKVLDQRIWSKMLSELLITTEDEEDFGISVRKEYWSESGTIHFSWAILAWGKLEEAGPVLIPILTRRYGQPEPPVLPPTEKPTPEQLGFQVITARRTRRIITGDEETLNQETEVRIPHRSGDRNSPTRFSNNKKLGDGKRRGAYAQLYSESFDPGKKSSSL